MRRFLTSLLVTFVLVLAATSTGRDWMADLARSHSSKPVTSLDPASTASARTEHTIDVLFAYTPAAGTALGGSRRVMDIALADLTADNDMLAKSGTNVRLRAAGVYRTTSDASGSFETDLDAYEHSPAFADLRSERDRLGADLVQVFTDTVSDGHCGIANIIPAGQADRSLGYSQLTRECAADPVSSIHEIGHNLGLDHDAYTLARHVSGPAHGLVDAAHHARTIMSYPNECTDKHISCVLVRRFSSPRLRFLDHPLGNANADAVSVINSTSGAIAALRASVGVHVDGSTPAFGAGNVETDVHPSLTLDTDVRDQRLDLRDAHDHPVAASVAISGRTITLTPQRPLDQRATYRMSVRGTTQPMSWTFTTGPGPHVVGLSASGDGVRLTFDHAVVWGSVAPILIDLHDGKSVQVRYVTDAMPNVSELALDAPLVRGRRYRIVIGEGMHDVLGNPLEATTIEVSP